jgi:hypothetical protein
LLHIEKGRWKLISPPKKEQNVERGEGDKRKIRTPTRTEREEEKRVGLEGERTHVAVCSQFVKDFD